MRTEDTEEGYTPSDYLELSCSGNRKESVKPEFRKSAFIRAFIFSIAALPMMAGVAFDAASIRVNNSGGEINNRPAEEKVLIEPRSITMTNVTLVRCMKEAYGVYPFQIGAPDWMNSIRYDIAARTANAAPEDQLRLMLQQLLAERFHLSLHHEHRDLSVYSLIRGKQEPRLRDAEHPDATSMGMSDGAVLFRGYSIGDFIATLAGPPFRVDRLSCEIHDRSRALDRRNERFGAVGRLPPDACDARNPRAGLVLPLTGPEASGQHEHFMALVGPGPAQRRPQEPRAAGDDNLHATVGRQPTA